MASTFNDNKAQISESPRPSNARTILARPIGSRGVQEPLLAIPIEILCHPQVSNPVTAEILPADIYKHSDAVVEESLDVVSGWLEDVA